MFGSQLIYRVHALRRMFERSISVAEVEDAVRNGSEIETYSRDYPYPSKLMLGSFKGKVLHVVAAYDESNDHTIVVTVYRPDPQQWSADFKVRKQV